MATTGRLTTAQRTALLAGAAVMQSWDILVPTSAAHAAYNEYEIDTGFLSGPGRLQRVAKAGGRTYEVWNPSPNVTRTPKAVRYSFTVDNSDGVFYETHDDNVFQVPSGYQATPAECRITHRVYVQIPDSENTRGWAFSEITHLTFTGRIIEVRHLDTADGNKDVVPAQSIITCEQVGAWEALRRVWTVEDATDHAMTGTGPGGLDYIWSVT